MKPSQLSAELRRIAAKIDASKRPDRHLVAGALKNVLRRVASNFKGAVIRWEGRGYNMKNLYDDFSASVAHTGSPFYINTGLQMISNTNTVDPNGMIKQFRMGKEDGEEILVKEYGAYEETSQNYPKGLTDFKGPFTDVKEAIEATMIADESDQENWDEVLGQI